VLIRGSRIPVEASMKFCQPCRNLADMTTHSLVHFFLSHEMSLEAWERTDIQTDRI
jgi:hypothetical protein